MCFELISDISKREIIAVGMAIREIKRLKKVHGPGNWRKVKGIAAVRLDDGFVTKAELHWYECHGVGKMEMKIKRYIV
jgi:hypothetical protein